MPFTIIISRFSNLLLFAQKMGGRRFAEISAQRCPDGRSVDMLFYGKNKNRILGKIERIVGKQDIKQIKRMLVSLEPSFTPYWQKTSKHLLLWKRYFQVNRLLSRQLIIDVENLSGAKHFVFSRTPIYFIPSPRSNDKEMSAWFSWMPRESFIVVEVPVRLKPSRNLFPLGILAHEFFHLTLRKNKKLMSQINGIAEKNEKLFAKLSDGHISNRMFLEELLMSSFIPEGYLSEKYLNIKITARASKARNLLAWRKLIAPRMYNVAREYVNDKRQVDKKYLGSVVEIIKQNGK